MYVIKRSGKHESIKFDKIVARLKTLCDIEPKLHESIIDPTIVAQKVVQGVYKGVKTTELDNLAAETAAYMSSIHLKYGDLAARIAVSNLHKQTFSDFYQVIKNLYDSDLISDEVFEFVSKNREILNSSIDYYKDYSYDYFGFKTLEKSYLMRIDNIIVERPQHMLMRVASGIHYPNLEDTIKTYTQLSEKWYTHATPTLFNSGTKYPQMSSCFLLTMKEDSINGIYDTLKQTAIISKNAGGIGLNISDIRATNSYIKGTNGLSNGIVPMLRVFNDTARYVDQGGGKRKGAFAVYLEPWHADIFQFLDLKKNHGKEEYRARDLFYGMWISDIFMRRCENDEQWSLFCPNECPGLTTTWGREFEQLYEKYESEGKAKRTVRAQELWFAILDNQIETGVPYMLYKDSCNAKSNQRHLGTIKGSNLCTEIIQYSAPDEIAVCNLASISLSKFVDSDKGIFDHNKLYQITYDIVINLNRIIDKNLYTLEEARNSNMRHRPIGLGVQGLADTFIKLRYPFTSAEAKELNKDIFETIYYAALSSSMDLAIKDGPYESFHNSPISKGIFQFDMWNIKPTNKWDWNQLKVDIINNGIRNSLLVAPMPTASTSQILGNNECFEPFTSNIYTRRVLAGEFTLINKHLFNDLYNLGIWNENIKNLIISDNGSVQNIKNIPQNIKDLYKTVWEIKQKDLVDMSADRGAFIDQSQSFSVHMAQPTRALLTSFHFYTWKKGLKTGMYYLRSRPAANAIQFTIDKSKLIADIETKGEVCEMIDGCVSCSG